MAGGDHPVAQAQQRQHKASLGIVKVDQIISPIAQRVHGRAQVERGLARMLAGPRRYANQLDARYHRIGGRVALVAVDNRRYAQARNSCAQCLDHALGPAARRQPFYA